MNVVELLEGADAYTSLAEIATGNVPLDVPGAVTPEFVKDVLTPFANC